MKSDVSPLTNVFNKCRQTRAVQMRVEINAWNAPT